LFLQLQLSQIMKQALESPYEEFGCLVDEVTALLCREDGKVGNLNVIGRLVEVKPVGEALIVGDLHGDIESLFTILKESDFIQKMKQDSSTFIVFLGDYGDRGEYSKEVYYTILKLKTAFPEQVILMRGNHEGPSDLLASPHNLPLEFQMKFGAKWEQAYSKIQNLFSCLYNAVIIEKRYLIVHGGLPVKATKVEDFAFAHKLHPKQTFLEELLWSDPSSMEKESCASPRGAGKLFGESVTDNILKMLNVKILIRGHEPCHEGFKINHNGKILTFFSRKGMPYFNAYGAYLQLNLSEEFGNANALPPYIHKF